MMMIVLGWELDGYPFLKVAFSRASKYIFHKHLPVTTCVLIICHPKYGHWNGDSSIKFHNKFDNRKHYFNKKTFSEKEISYFSRIKSFWLIILAWEDSSIFLTISYNSFVYVSVGAPSNSIIFTKSFWKQYRWKYFCG